MFPLCSAASYHYHSQVRFFLTEMEANKLIGRKLINLGYGMIWFVRAMVNMLCYKGFGFICIDRQVPHSGLFLQILFPGNWRGCSSFRRELIHRYSSGDSAFFGISNGTHLQKSFLPQATGSLFTGTIEKIEQPVSTFRSLCQNELDKINCMVYDLSEAVVEGDGGLTYVENEDDVFPVEAVVADVSPVEAVTADVSPAEAVVPDVSPVESLSAETLTEKTSSLIDSVESGTKSTVDISPDSSVSLPDTLDLNPGSLPDAKASFDDFSSGVKESFTSSLNQGENAVKNTLESFSSSVTSITKNASEVVDSAVNRTFSTLDQTGDIAGDKFSSFSTGLKEASNRAAAIAIDLLRQSVSIAESSLTNGVSFVVYSYGSAKDLLPPDVKSALNSSEDVALKVLRPVGSVLQQVLCLIY